MMTYDEARKRAQSVVMLSSISPDFMRKWNKLENDLQDLPFREFNAIHREAVKGVTEADLALICMCEG